MPSLDNLTAKEGQGRPQAALSQPLRHHWAEGQLNTKAMLTRPGTPPRNLDPQVPSVLVPRVSNRSSDVRFLLLRAWASTCLGPEFRWGLHARQHLMMSRQLVLSWWLETHLALAFEE